MKAFLWLVILVFLGICGYFIFAAMLPDESRMISLAFGNSDEDTVEIHVELSTLMAGEDTFAYMTGSGSIDRNAWANAHYLITDPAGTQVQLRHNIKSNLISDRDTRGYHDSFLIGELKPGTDYTFIYLPVVGEPEQYRYTFTAPATNEGRKRVTFEAM